jgi:hypothetical protein
MAEDLNDKKGLVQRSSTTDTSASNDSMYADRDRDSTSLSLRKSTSGASRTHPHAIAGGPNNTAAVTAATTNATYLECDYDLNPTVLYQAIEAKQWEYALSIFTKHEQEDQSATWVVRKETNGKLRWRLLPLHAAVIFGSPLSLIELLLADYPAAAQSKDDQGMLPLHLAFRNESNWDVIEELVTAYPAAVFVPDRKGRTPLQCGIRQANNYSTSSASTAITTPTSGYIISSSQQGRLGNATSSTGKANNSAVATTISRTNTGLSDSGTSTAFIGTSKSSTFRSVVNVLDVYSQISVSGERKRAEQEARTLAQASITQLKDSQIKTLAALKSEWEKQQQESKRQMNELTKHNTSLERRVRELEQQLARKIQDERRLQARYRRVEVALQNADDRVTSNNNNNNPNAAKSSRTTPLLSLAMQEQMEEMLTHFKEMLAERDQIRSIFLKDHPLIADEQQGKESALVKDLERLLMIEHGESLGIEEKKFDDQTDSLPMSATPSTAKTSSTKVLKSAPTSHGTATLQR